MVMALFCFTVARARAMFAELLVWFAEPARSCAPHFDGAHFSSMGLSDTGPFKVCAEAAAAKDSRIAARTAEWMTECLMDISFSAGVSGRELSCGFTGGRPRSSGDFADAFARSTASFPTLLMAIATSEFTMDAMPRARSVASEAMSFSSRTRAGSWSESNTPNFPLALVVPASSRAGDVGARILPTTEASRSSSARPRSEPRTIIRGSEGGNLHGRLHRQDALPAHGRGH